MKETPTYTIYADSWPHLKKVFGPVMKVFVATMFSDFKDFDNLEYRDQSQVRDGTL